MVQPFVGLPSSFGAHASHALVRDGHVKDVKEKATVSIIIVSYNSKEWIIECLRSVYDQTTSVTFEVIVLDNASSDGSAEEISAQFPDVDLITRSDNVGFGRGCNAAARHANGEFVLLLNPDTVLVKDTIGELVKFAHEFPDAGIWGGKMVDKNGRFIGGSCWRFPTLWSIFCTVSGLSRILPRSGLFNGEAYGDWNGQVARRVDVVSGCLFLIRMALWDSLGGFDPIFFLYSEEVDLCRRARRLGVRPMVSPKVEVIHHVGMTQPVRAERLVRLLKGKRTYMRRHWTPAADWAGKVLLLLWPLSRHLCFLIPAVLIRNGSLMKSAQSWGAVWRRRREWLSGYTG